MKFDVSVGKRKKAIARAYVAKGSGNVRINSKLLDLMEPKYVKQRVEEPLILARNFDKKILDKYNISVTVKGGGVWGQADAVRTAIGNALVQINPKLKPLFTQYDRNILISDSRRTEPHKPSRSSAGPRRKKQQSKR